MLHSLVTGFKNLANHPAKVVTISLSLALASVVLDGTALRLWSLHREHDSMTDRIVEAGVRSGQLAVRIDEAHSPQFIERAARDQFDFVQEGDLVFIFPDEPTAEVAENSSGL